MKDTQGFVICYLPTYNSSCKNIEATMVVMTVHRGLNIAEKSGPLCDMHQAWTKKVTADPIPYP